MIGFLTLDRPSSVETWLVTTIPNTIYMWPWKLVSPREKVFYSFFQNRSFIYLLAMSHYKGNRSTVFYLLYKAIERDRGLAYDYRIKEQSFEKPALFRRRNGYLQPDYRHVVCLSEIFPWHSIQWKYFSQKKITYILAHSRFRWNRI